MENTPTILFLCPHNAAKSVLAAAYCERAVRERGLSLRVASAGTDPAGGVNPIVIGMLRSEGIDVSGYRPRRVTREAMTAAWRIISLGCQLEDLPRDRSTPVERWDDVPAPKDDAAGARAAIGAHISALISDFEQAQRMPGTASGEGPSKPDG